MMAVVAGVGGVGGILAAVCAVIFGLFNSIQPEPYMVRLFPPRPRLFIPY